MGPADYRMVAWLTGFRRIAVAVSPAVTVFVLTLAISLVTGHPEGLFLTRSIRGVPLRFVALMFVLLAPILILPKLLTFTGNISKNRDLLGQQLVKAIGGNDRELDKLTTWVLRPIQGISLSLILAERFLGLLEFSTGLPYTRLLISIGLFFIGGLLTSTFL